MAEKVKRRFARAKEALPVKLKYDDGERQFEAEVQTFDISVSGVFVAAEFFLKPGMILDLEFHMPNDDRPVRTRGIIVREVRLDEEHRGSPRTVSGFALKFIEYFADAKTILASSFLIVELDDFIEDYLTRRTRKPESERGLLREVIVAWEVGKMEMTKGEIDLLRESIQVDSDGRIRRQQPAPGLRSPTTNASRPTPSAPRPSPARLKPSPSRSTSKSKKTKKGKKRR